MISLDATAILVAAVTSLGLAAAALARRPRGHLQWSFAVGMTALALESATAFMLLTQTDDPADRLRWLTVIEILGILLLVPWGVFVAALGHSGSRPLPHGLRRLLSASGAVLIAVVASVLFHPAFEIAEVDGPFYAARIGPPARLGILLEIVSTIAILAALEAALRTSAGVARWRTKYLVLGLGGIFLVRFYFLSQVALFNVMFASYLSTAAATQVIGNVAIGIGLARDTLGSELALSRRVVYRSVVVAVLGLYLLAVGLLGFVLDRLGIAEELFWGSTVVFITAFALAATMLSEAIRWRMKKFIATNFYRSKYDYRLQWTHFTKRLGSLLTVEELAPELLRVVVETVGTRTALLFLADPRDGRHHPVAAVGLPLPDDSLGPESALVSAISAAKGPLIVAESWPLEQLEFPPRSGIGEGAMIVPLRWRGHLSGIMVVGPERTGVEYTSEDSEFLATVAEQAAGAITTARLSESLAQARAFETFHRVTSFLIHDLKNSISALSMLSENAAKHFDDPEFQRDAISTLGRTVERMRRLMGRLSSPRDASALKLEPVDLAALVVDAAIPLVKDSRIGVVKDLAAVPPVCADAEALLRVIQNLITNAVQSIQGDGLVKLRTYERDGKAVVEVSDTGCGMSEEFVRKYLFAPFRTTKRGGWGIGLYQAKGIIEAHGGTIEVSSKEGSGTTFGVLLPLSRGGGHGQAKAPDRRG